jgi:Holliday junction resolvasome RuvABC endonuclease subunit
MRTRPAPPLAEPWVITNPEPPYVLGVDSALARTGVAVIERTPDGCRARTYVITTDTPTNTGDPVAERCRRITTIGRRFDAIVRETPELALIEAPALDAEYGNSWDRAGVFWWIGHTLIDHHRTKVAMIAPTTLKKWVLGYAGSAKHPVEKGHIVAGMHEMWPGVPCTSNDLRHHECEALAMAHMCAQHLGWPVPIRSHHGGPLAVVKWPKRAPTPVH